MELIVLEEAKNKMVFQLKGETHTFCNALKEALHEVKGVTVATYTIDHPLIGVPKFMMETKDLEPRKALKEALKLIKKKAEEFRKEVTKL